MTRSTPAVPPPSRDLVEELVIGNRIIFDQKIVKEFHDKCDHFRWSNGGKPIPQLFA